MTDDGTDAPSPASPAAGRHRQVLDGELPDGGFLVEPSDAPEVERFYARDVAEVGFVMNVSRAWAHLPSAHDELYALLGRAAETAGLTFRHRAILICASASTVGDPHCALAWGARLAGEVGHDVAAGVLQGDDSGLSAQEQALAAWSRRVAGDPNGIDSADVQALRDAGYAEQEIFAITLFVALRLAVSTVNDALGARPDRELHDGAPAPVRDAVAYGRPVAPGPDRTI